MRRKKRRLALGVAAAAGIAAVAVTASAIAGPGDTTVVAGEPSLQGPSSSQTPYIIRTQPGLITESVLTTGDSVGGYRMAGTPDGLGAFDNGDGTFTVLMNHEIPNTSGVARAHGSAGAFVSKWVIDKATTRC